MHFREPGSLQKSHSLRKGRLWTGWFVISEVRASHAGEDVCGFKSAPQLCITNRLPVGARPWTVGAEAGWTLNLGVMGYRAPCPWRASQFV